MSVRWRSARHFVLGMLMGLGCGWLAASGKKEPRGPVLPGRGAIERPSLLRAPPEQSDKQKFLIDDNHFTVGLFPSSSGDVFAIGADPPDARLALRDAVGSLLKGTTLETGTSEEDQAVFLAAWERYAATDRSVQQSSDVEGCEGQPPDISKGKFRNR